MDFIYPFTTERLPPFGVNGKDEIIRTNLLICGFFRQFGSNPTNVAKIVEKYFINNRKMPIQTGSVQNILFSKKNINPMKAYTITIEIYPELANHDSENNNDERLIDLEMALIAIKSKYQTDNKTRNENNDNNSETSMESKHITDNILSKICATKKNKSNTQKMEKKTRWVPDLDDADENPPPSNSCINIKQCLKDFAWEKYDDYNCSDSGLIISGLTLNCTAINGKYDVSTYQTGFKFRNEFLSESSSTGDWMHKSRYSYYSSYNSNSNYNSRFGYGVHDTYRNVNEVDSLNNYLISMKYQHGGWSNFVFGSSPPTKMKGSLKSFGINVILVPLQFYLTYGDNDIYQLKHRKDMYQIGNNLEKKHCINDNNRNEVLMIVCADKDNSSNNRKNGKHNTFESKMNGNSYDDEDNGDHGDIHMHVDTDGHIDVNVNAGDVLKAFTIFQKYDRNDFQRVMKEENIFQDIVIFNSYFTSFVNAKHEETTHYCKSSYNLHKYLNYFCIYLESTMQNIQYTVSSKEIPIK